MVEQEWLTAAQAMIPALVDDLAKLVNIDSGTYQPEGTDRMAQALGAWLADQGAHITFTPAGKVEDGEIGPHLVATINGGGRNRVLLIGHTDTVYRPGSVAQRPFSIDGDRAFGPGVCDMKSGLLIGLYALRLLQRFKNVPFGELTFLFNSDEEIGSPTSQFLIQEHAKLVDSVLVLEPAPGGDMAALTVGRKGLLKRRLKITGRSAHAGVEPERGAHALLALAHQIIALQALNGRWEGVTVNVGVASGGSQDNVVPDIARAEIEARAPTRRRLEAAARAIDRIASRSFIPGTRTEITGWLNDTPFEPRARSAALFGAAEEVGAALGITLYGRRTGGVSDANTAAAAGAAAILDGLGAAGGDEHNLHDEYIVLSSLAPRVALLAGLLAKLAAA